MAGRIRAAMLVRAAFRRYDAGDFAGAEERVKAALALRPGLENGDMYLGILALKQGRAGEAKALLEKAYAGSADPSTAAALGAACLMLGEHAAARGFFEAAIKAFPVLFDLRYHIGLSWLLEGRRRKAVEEFHAMALREDGPLFERIKRLKDHSGGGK